jgi:hypothetical protein
VAKKIKVQCPCGYAFEYFNNEETAILEIKSHFEHFHSNFLPFGITEMEALSLAKIVEENRGKELRDRRRTSFKKNFPTNRSLLRIQMEN